MRVKLLKLIIIFFVIVIYIPRIPLFLIPGISSILRLDTIVTILYAIFSLLYILLYKREVLIYFVLIYFSIFLFSTKMGLFIYIPSFLLYCSYFTTVFLFEDVLSIIDLKIIIKWIISFVHLNIIIHFFSLITGFHISSNNIGLEDDLLIFGPFGLMFAPYNFTILLVVGAFLEFFRNKKVYSFSFFLIFLALIFANSRAGFASFSFIILFEIVFFSNNKKNIFIILAVILFGILSISFIDTLGIKSLTTLNNVDVSNDASWLMRVESFNNWIEWLTTIKFLFGGGAQIFVTFVTQYGLPGPFDNLYLRILSETGLFGLILFLYFMLIYKNFNISSRIFAYSFLWMLFFSFFNESFLAIKGGHLFWLYIAIIKSRKYKYLLYSK